MPSSSIEEQDFAGAELSTPRPPRDRGWSGATRLRAHLVAAAVDRNDDALRSEPRRLLDQIGGSQAAVPIRPCRRRRRGGARPRRRTDPAADCERHEALVGELVDQLIVGRAVLWSRECRGTRARRRLASCRPSSPAWRADRPPAVEPRALDQSRSPVQEGWNHARLQHQTARKFRSSCAPTLTLLRMELHAERIGPP